MKMLTEKEVKAYQEAQKKLYEGKTPDQEIHIEGVGTIKVYGKWPVEKMIKKLLTYKEITG